MTQGLKAVGLVKAFGGVRAVDGVSLQVAPGEIVALIGPNGAGKSTCFSLLAGAAAPDAGSVAVNGRDIAGRGAGVAWRAGVGRTFQIARPFASMTVREAVSLAIARHAGRIYDPWRDLTRWSEAALAVLARTGLSDLAETATGVLAHGDVKRVDLAIALAGAPSVLLLDEPTAGMPLAERRDLMTLVAALATAENLAVLFTEHDMDVVFGHAQRVLVMHRGRVIASGDPAAVRADPTVRAVYLGGAVETADA